MIFTHTPGPWVNHGDAKVFSDLGAESGDGRRADSTNAWAVAECGRGALTYVDGKPTYLSDPTNEANARLIAAAPDMLEVLQALVTAVDEGSFGVFGLDTEHPLMDRVRHAIAKAKGEAA